MRERLLMFGLAAAALVLFYALFLPQPAPPAQQASRPLSTETGADGLATAWHWLQLEHVAVVSFRERYERLAATPGIPPAGNLLISEFPQRLPMRSAETAALQSWIRRGNSLLVLAALDDTPRWAVSAQAELLERLTRLTRIRFTGGTAAPGGTRQRLGEALPSLQAAPLLRIAPLGAHPLLAGVHEVQDASALPASRWHGQPLPGSAALAIAQLRTAHAPVMWVEPEGRGQLIVCAFAAAFSNAQLRRADNAQLLANLIAWSRAPGGRVLFDDAHQGLVAFYDPQAFFADARLHRSLGWILVLWLVWVLGSQSLRSRACPWRPVDETALIDAGGRFFAASVPEALAARRLLANFFAELRSSWQREPQAPLPWQWLAAQPGVSDAECAQLRVWSARAEAGRRVDLAKLQNLLVQLRGRIA